MGRYYSGSCIEEILNAVFGWAFCIGILLYGAEYLHKWIPGIPTVALAVILAILIISGSLGYSRYAEYRQQLSVRNRLCPHGVKGGQTLGLCELCLEEKREADRKRTAEREEVERKQRISQDAKRLRIEELIRIEKQKVKSLEHLHSLHPREFEDVIAAMYRNLGYSVRQTPYSNDGGKDAIAEKDGITYVIECKRYGPDKAVGRPEIQKFSAAVVEQRSARGLFVTTGRFTETAIANARQHEIELIDGDKLVQLMRRAFPDTGNEDFCRVMCLECGDVVCFPKGMPEKQCAHGHPVKNDLLETENGPTLLSGKKRCDRCGREMRIVTGRRGKFWGCTGYPDCRYTEPYERLSR